MEGEPFGWQTARDESTDSRVGSGYGKHVDARSDGRVGDLSARISDSRSAGIADDGDTRAQFQLGHKLLGARALVVHVVADGGGVDLEVVEQLLRLPGVLAGYAVDTSQNAQCP